MPPSIVLFLGAGFSRELGLPLTSDFFQLGISPAKDIARLGIEITRLRSIEPLKAALAAADTNIEHLLDKWEDTVSQLEDGNPDASDSETGRAQLQDYLLNLLTHIETRTQGSRGSPIAMDLSNWVRRAVTSWTLSIVTTNYDRCFEYMLGHAGLNFEYVFSDPRRVPVRKLHGSVNWLIMGPEFARQHDHSIPQAIGEIRGGRIVDIHLEDLPLTAAGPSPVIIPPRSHKRYSGIFRQQCEDARHLLCNATRILFVGYSFSPVDAEICALLKESVARSNPERLVVVDPMLQAHESAVQLLDGTAVKSCVDNWNVAHFDSMLT